MGGVYGPGDRLPRQHDLAGEFGVAFSTLKRALDILEEEGYIVRKVGRGAYAVVPEKQKPVALVVDDEEDIRELFRASLDQLGWDAVLAGSGEDALLQAKERSFDMTFIDLLMPTINVAETFKHIRRIDPESSVVIVTGYADSIPMQEALLTGPFAVMRKPFSIDDLRLVIKTLCGSLFLMTGTGASPFLRSGRAGRRSPLDARRFGIDRAPPRLVRVSAGPEHSPG